MTQRETIEALVRTGVPRDKAERAAGVAATIASVIPTPATELAFPFTIVLPWSALCSDNDRETASLYKNGDGTIVARKVLTARYKVAREKIRELAKRIVGDAAAADLPVTLTACVFVPDERLHDVVNFAKGVHDALEKIVYVNDKWLYRSLWERAGVDVDAPRAEIMVRPL